MLGGQAFEVDVGARREVRRNALLVDLGVLGQLCEEGGQLTRIVL